MEKNSIIRIVNLLVWMPDDSARSTCGMLLAVVWLHHSSLLDFILLPLGSLQFALLTHVSLFCAHPSYRVYIYVYI